MPSPGKTKKLASGDMAALPFKSLFPTGEMDLGSWVPAHLRPEVILMIHRKAIQLVRPVLGLFSWPLWNHWSLLWSPKFYFFYEIQREVLILLLPGRYHFMSSLSISQYTRARAIGLDLSFCIDPWWHYRDAHSLWAPEPKGNNRLFIRQSVHPCRSPQQDPGHANLFPCSWGGWGCRGQNWVAKGGGEMNWGVGVDIYALLIPCIIQMTNENLLYHTGTSTWCSVVP